MGFFADAYRFRGAGMGAQQRCAAQFVGLAEPRGRSALRAEPAPRQGIQSAIVPHGSPSRPRTAEAAPERAVADQSACRRRNAGMSSISSPPS
jgi:hypothetical protein